MRRRCLARRVRVLQTHRARRQSGRPASASLRSRGAWLCCRSAANSRMPASTSRLPRSRRARWITTPTFPSRRHLRPVSTILRKKRSVMSGKERLSILGSNSWPISAKRTRWRTARIGRKGKTIREALLQSQRLRKKQLKCRRSEKRNRAASGGVSVCRRPKSARASWKRLSRWVWWERGPVNLRAAVTTRLPEA